MSSTMIASAVPSAMTNAPANEEPHTSSRCRRRNRRKEQRENAIQNVASPSKMVNSPKGRAQGKKKFNTNNHTTFIKVQQEHLDVDSSASTASTASLSDSSSSMTASDTTVPQHVNVKVSKKQQQKKKLSKQQQSKQKLAKQQSFEDSFTSQFVALDCEMVGIGEGGHKSALARVSIVNWDGLVVFDTFVRVTEEVTDYRTFVSGVRESDIDGSCPEITMEFDDCVRQVSMLLQDKVLVGHGLKSDLRALGISHPWYDIRDTTKFDAFLKDTPTGLRVPRKLKDLAKENLSIDIQCDGEAHSPIVDAVTAMNLYKPVANKWEKAMLYKKEKTLAIMSQQTTAVQN